MNFLFNYINFKKLSVIKPETSTFLLFLCLAFLLIPSVHAIDLEQQLKTVYLGRLPNYITWPTATGQHENYKFKLCVFGTHKFDGLLDALYKTKTIQNKPIEIHYVSEIEQVEICHLLFIGAPERKQVAKILQYVNNKPILTVGESRGFTDKNGMIQFYMRAQKVRIKINYQAVINHGFKIAAPLLSIANVVNR